MFLESARNKLVNWVLWVNKEKKVSRKFAGRRNGLYGRRDRNSAWLKNFTSLFYPLRSIIK